MERRLVFERSHKLNTEKEDRYIYPDSVLVILRKYVCTASTTVYFYSNLHYKVAMALRNGALLLKH